MGARLMGSRMRSRARNGRDGAERRVTVQEGSQEAGSWLRAHQAGYEGFVGERRPDYQSSAYDLIRDLAGSVSGSPPDLTEQQREYLRHPEKSETALLYRRAKERR